MVHLLFVRVFVFHKTSQLGIRVVVGKWTETPHFSLDIVQVIEGVAIFVFFCEKN